MKYSLKLDRMIDQIDSSSTTPEQRFALIDFQLQLEIGAPENACYSCANGEFFIQYWHDQKKGVDTWSPILGHCHAFMVLARNDEYTPGLQLPNAPFCTSFKAEKAEEEGKS